MEIAGQVAVQVKADLALLEKGFEQAKRQAERFDQSASKSIRATDQATKQFAATATQTAAAIQTAANANTRLAGTMHATGLQTANIAAQLNDIGVTLASGQSPFMVAIQQGTQLNQVFGGMGARGALGALAGAFTSLLNPVSLATIAIIGLGGAAIQYFTDLLSDAEKTEEALKKEASLIRAVADEWGAALPSLRAYADERDRLKAASDREAATQIAVNDAYRTTNATIEVLRDQLVQLRADLEFDGTPITQISELQRQWNELTEKVEAHEATQEDVNKLMEVTVSLFASQQQGAINFGTSIASVLLPNLQKAIDLQRQYNSDLGFAKALQSPLGSVPPVFSAGGQFIDEAELQNVRAEGTKSQFQTEQEREARRGGSRRGLSDAEKMTRDYKDMVRSATEFIKAQELEAQVLGMTEEAANALRYEQELLNQAANDNIKLTPKQSEELTRLATEMAAAEEATRRATEAFEFQRETLRGVADDFISAFEDGKITLQEFGDIALNVLDKIADKLLDDAFSGGGAGGLLGLLGGLFGGGGGLGGLTWGTWAKGGAFSGGNVIPFARGGVVSRPTLFPMANGAGLMGEAGPEGILPLRRNSQGQLGVMAQGAANSNQAQGLDVDVRVFVDQDGNWQAKVEGIAQRTATRTTAAGIDQYDRFVLPGSVKRVKQDPRKVG
jgi:lambda family phage tail tape measure protein